jgi:hypothetical protein
MTRTTAARGALLAVGIVGLLAGLLLLVTTARPIEHPSIAVWLVGAIVVHDGLVAGVVVVASLVGRRLRRRLGLPLAPVLVAQGGLVVAGIVTAVVAPEIAKQAIGTNNPSVLPLDYVGHLVAVDAAVLIATAVVASVTLFRARGRRSVTEP